MPASPPIAPALLMELADSEVRQCVRQGRDLYVHFSAAAAVQPQADGPPLGGFVSQVTWVLLDCAQIAGPDTVFGRIRNGSVQPAGGAALRQLALPSAWSGALTLELEWAQGGVARWEASGLRCERSEASVFRESWAC